MFSSFKKKDGDLVLAQARIKDLESQYNQSEAALNTALSENAALAADLADLKTQLAKVPFLTSPHLCIPQIHFISSGCIRVHWDVGLFQAEDAHAVAKKQLETETLMRVDLENRCQSLSEELQFRKSMFEEVRVLAESEVYNFRLLRLHRHRQEHYKI